MHTETIAGLHKCQPKNAPEAGTIKNMVVLNMPAKNGKKAWIKIKSEKPEKGGSPYRLLNVEPLDWPPDDYGNIAFNIEVEATTAQPTAFANARATMQQGRDLEDVDPHGQHGEVDGPPHTAYNAPQSQPHAQQGVTEARKHLMRCCNLYNLCVAAAEKVIAPGMPEVARTSEQFQSTLASLWIEASGRRSTNGVDWWSYIDKMPATSLAPNGKHSTTDSSIQKESNKAGLDLRHCACDNTKGDNPLCPIHSS